MGIQDSNYEGVIGRNRADSQAWWPPLPGWPDQAPNVVMVLLDDVGFAQFGCYGSNIATTTFDRLAANGLRYSSFHTTALCSPTRACLLSGRNHHSNAMARTAEAGLGFPGYHAMVPKENGFLSEILLANGYATFAVGKWHLVPASETTTGSPRDRWPLSRGFERYYGFLSGETDQFHPDLVYDNHQVDPPKSAAEGYHLTEDLAEKAMLFIKDLRAHRPGKPFFLYFTPGACHSPHQAPREFIDRYRGMFDQGWDTWRDEVFGRQVASGLFNVKTQASDRPSWVQPWDSLSADERRLYARMMEVYAGFLEHTDHQVGRVLDFIDSLGEMDNTIVLIMSDNGASGQGGAVGSFNQNYYYNNTPESLQENLRRIEELGGPTSYNHYPWGWAWAGNTPFKRWKRETHEGGVCDPLIVHWPARLGQPGQTRHQYVHAIDVMPTILDVIGISPPQTLNGIPQNAIHGASFAASLTDAQAPSPRLTQYYEMLGSRALYHDGWKAVAFRPIERDTSGQPDPTDAPYLSEWELYHVAEDPSETNDLAATRPDKLQEMVERWWVEVGRFDVLPIFTGIEYEMGDWRFWEGRDSYVFHPGIGSMIGYVAPILINRAYTIVAELEVPPSGDVSGVLVAHGNHAGGYSLYLKDRRLHFAYNFLGETLTTVTASVELPPGSVEARLVFTPTGAFRGEAMLFYGDVPVGAAVIPRTHQVGHGIAGFCVGYQRSTPVTPAYSGRFEVTPEVLRVVRIEALGELTLDIASEQRVELVQQ